MSRTLRIRRITGESINRFSPSAFARSCNPADHPSTCGSATLFSLLGRCARLSCSPAPARQGGLRSQARPSSAPHTPASFSVRTSVFSFLGEYRAGRDEGAQAVHRPVAPCFGSSLFRNAAMPHGAVIAQAHYIIKSSRGMSVTIIDIGNAPALVIRVLPQTASSLH
jgi:hypothetical protein